MDTEKIKAELEVTDRKIKYHRISLAALKYNRALLSAKLNISRVESLIKRIKRKSDEKL